MVLYINPKQYYWYRYSRSLYFLPTLLVAVSNGLTKTQTKYTYKDKHTSSIHCYNMGPLNPDRLFPVPFGHFFQMLCVLRAFKRCTYTDTSRYDCTDGSAYIYGFIRLKCDDDLFLVQCSISGNCWKQKHSIAVFPSHQVF